MVLKLLGLLALQVVVISPTSSAQSAQDLLRETAEHYKALDGYEFDGALNVRFPRSGWQTETDVALLFPLKGSLPERFMTDTSSYRTTRNVKTGTGTIPDFGFPQLGFSSITKHMLGVENAGSDNLSFNGGAIKCDKLRVRYSSTLEHPHPKLVTYWIDTTQHLVLKEQFTDSIHPNNVEAIFTIAYRTVRFNIPTPQQLLDNAAAMAARGDVSERTEWTGKPAPDFTLPLLTGSNVTLSSLRGKPVLLDFWAIACAPCRREMPIVESLSANYRNRVEVLEIAWDDSEKARGWLSKNNHPLSTLIDSDSLASDRFKVQGIPALILIGKDGTILHFWEGPASEDTLQVALNAALK